MDFEISDATTAEQLKQLMRTSNSILNSLPGGSNAGSMDAGGGVLLGNLHAHQLVSTNSFEMPGGGTSISEDSGLPYTNSSVSSGDSIRCVGGLYKLEMELTESDGEVSQFDSLDNCSDGGMSAENFNTLKKGPLAPIDPPPQFQDSPQTTLLRSPQLQIFAQRLTRSLIKNSIRSFINHHHHTHQRSYDLTPLDPDRLAERLSSFSVQRHHLSAQELSSGTHLDFFSSVTTTDEEDDPENIYDVPTMDIDDLSPDRRPGTTNSSGPASSTTPATARRHANPSCEIYDYDIYYNKNNTATTTTTTSSSHNTNSTSSGSKKHYLDTIQRKKPALYSPRHYHPTGGSNLSTANRPNSRNSLNSRLSSSHNSLSVPTTNKADDSIFITQAMSHDTLTGREITDFYNVPIDSDMYSLPVDMVVGMPAPVRSSSPKPVRPISAAAGYKNLRGKLKCPRNQKKRRKPSGSAVEIEIATEFKYSHPNNEGSHKMKSQRAAALAEAKRYSVPENTSTSEPMHMTLDEVKRHYHSMYSSSSEGSVSDVIAKATKKLAASASNAVGTTPSLTTGVGTTNNNNHIVSGGSGNEAAVAKTCPAATSKNISPSPAKKKSNAAKSGTMSATKNATVNLKNRKTSVKDAEIGANHNNNNNSNNNNNNHSSDKYGCGGKKSQFSINLNLKQKFCSIFRFRRSGSAHISGGGGAGAGGGASGIGGGRGGDEYEHTTNRLNGGGGPAEGRPPRAGKQSKNPKFMTRALPPLPNRDQLPEELATTSSTPDEQGQSGAEKKPEDSTMDFAANIEKVKEYGWYWGPISSEAAEKILSNEPDGSFIVRDSSDDHYIFSLTFKLNNSVRHVRIEQDQGTFSFGSCAKFKSHTIMEFIENAVESSRSGRYLFFFHRRPEHGPMRVQLTNPVSRFKHIQSLQHMCRFVIRKTVIRKDLIQTLPLPRRLLDYLGYKNCFSEQIESDSSQTADEEDPRATPVVADTNESIDDGPL